MSYKSREQLKSEILEAIGSHYSYQEIVEHCGRDQTTVSAGLNDLIAEGKIQRVSKGNYILCSENVPSPVSAIANIQPPPAPPTSNGNGHHLAESSSRKVALPEYMRGRPAITLFVERSPEEIENVMRLELQIGGMWLALPIQGDIRLCTGNDIPRYSAQQETYTGVTAFRVTTRAGEQFDYAHNAQMPLTVDAK